MTEETSAPCAGILLAELVASRKLVAELRRRDEARDPSHNVALGDVQLACAVRQFAHLMTRPRVMMGLARRSIMGRDDDVWRNVDIMLRQSRIPSSLDVGILWLAGRRAILGMLRRWAVGGRIAAEGTLVLALERQFKLFQDPPAPRGDVFGE